MQVSRHLLAILAAGAAMTLPVAASVTYSPGVYIMNEEQSNGSINFFNPTGEGSWDYRAFRRANPGKEIPGAICHAHIHAGKLFIVSNHLSESGSYAGTLTVADAATLGYITSVELVNKHGNPVQGRCAISADYRLNYIGDHTVLVSTTDGILLYRVDNGVLETNPGFEVAVSPDGVASPSPFQFPYQTGSMAQVGNMVYVASQSYGLVCIPLFQPADKVSCISVSDMFPDGLPDGLTADCGIGSVVVSADGDLWMSVTADRNASGIAAPALIKYDVATKKFEAIPIPGGIYAPANSWYAWTPDGFHADPTVNVLYWNGGPDTWFSNSAVFKYDIDKGEFSRIIDLGAYDNGQWKIYGCSMRTSPVSGEMYLSLFKDYALMDYRLLRLGSDGKVAASHQMDAGYWFPSLPVFSDIKSPELKDFEELILPADVPTTIDLFGAATDPDSPDAQILYRVIQGDESHEGIYNLATDWRSVTITPGKADGAAHWVEIVADSQGRKATGKIPFRFSTASVDGVEASLKPVAASVSRGVLTLRNETAVAQTAVVYTPAGAAVLTIDAPVGESEHSLDVLAPGVYIVRFGTATVKFGL